MVGYKFLKFYLFGFTAAFLVPKKMFSQMVNNYYQTIDSTISTITYDNYISYF